MAGRTETIVVIASGPSLTQADCDLAKQHFITLAVSDAYKLIDANYQYACDQKWWSAHLPINGKAKKYTQVESPSDIEWAESRGIIPVAGISKAGLGLDKIHHNHNSGAQAINLAYLLGARRIILLGFDMQWTDNKSHFFGDHPAVLRNVNPTIHIPHFTQLAAELEREGVEVINCTRETALHQFRRATLEQVI